MSEVQLLPGLHKQTKDENDFPLGALSVIPDLSEVHPLGLKPRKILNQLADGNDDFCTAYAIAGGLSNTEGADLFPDFQMASSLDLSPSTWGQDLRAAMAAPTKNGIAETHPMLPKSQRKQFSYYDSYKKDAMLHKQGSYFKTSGPYEPVDNVRAWLFKYRSPVFLGVEWGWQLNQYELSGTPAGFGHCVYAVDSTEDGRLIAVNSAGYGAGQQGMHLISRETANRYIMDYGAYMFQDLNREEAQAAVDMYRSDSNWLCKIVIRLFS